MSKAECNRAYLRHKMAMEASYKSPKMSKVAKIFKRKPYSSTNYTVWRKEEKDEQGR